MKMRLKHIKKSLLTQGRHGILYNSSAIQNVQFNGFHKISAILSLDKGSKVRPLMLPQLQVLNNL